MSKNKREDQVQDGKIAEMDKQGEGKAPENNENKLGLVGSIGQKLVDADKKRADKKLARKQAKEAKAQEKADKEKMPLAGKIGIAAAVIGAALGGAAVYVANRSDDGTIELTNGECSVETAAIPEMTAVSPAEEPVKQAEVA